MLCRSRAAVWSSRAARSAVIAAALAGTACRRESGTKEAVGSLDAPEALLFVAVTSEAGIDFQHENGARGGRFMPETTVGGAGWIDYDRDGLLDLYLVNGNTHPDTGAQGEETNRLYKNLGAGRFRDVTAQTGCGDRGYGAGLAVGDYDNDGWPDLYVTNYGPNVLLHNEGGRGFRDVTAHAGVAAGGWSSSAAFFDCDRDGLLDLYVCRYVDFDPAHKCASGGISSYCSPGEFSGVPDVLYRNRGDGTFADVSRSAGVAIAGPHAGKSLGVVVLDYDDDGDPDVFVACDQVPNILLRNRGGGSFEDVALLADVAYSSAGESQAGMGVDAGDVDLDGLADIVVTNFADEPNSLYHNQGRGFFSERSAAFGLAGPSLAPLGFGVLLVDCDLDSDLDLFVANGHVQDNVALLRPGQSFAQSAQIFANASGKSFRDVSGRAGAWFAEQVVGRAAASADYDEDGDEDIVVLNSGGRPALLRNDSRRGHWIAFRLTGSASNRDGYGAKLTVRFRRGPEPLRRVFECRSARSYASACDPRVRVGLGGGDVAVDGVEIRWPSGKLQQIEAPGIDRVVDVREP